MYSSIISAGGFSRVHQLMGSRGKGIMGFIRGEVNCKFVLCG